MIMEAELICDDFVLYFFPLIKKKEKIYPAFFAMAKRSLLIYLFFCFINKISYICHFYKLN